MNGNLHALAGIAGLLAIAWGLGEKRRSVPWRAIVAGLALQLALATVLLKLPLAKRVFLVLNDAMLALEKATEAGTSFVFGYLGGGAPPFAVANPAASFILAFRALPLVLVVSALSALLFYWRVLPAVVRAISWLLERTMGVGGVVGLSTAANVFVGMVEAPLVVSFMMVPPEGAATGGRLALTVEAESSMDALTRGALDGMQLLINIVAMLVVFVALVTLATMVIAPYTLQQGLGWLLAPLAWLCGVPWAEASTGGMLLGTKTVLNELVAYVELARAPGLSERSRLLLAYALCGFANFGSLGIMIGGMSTMCPERRGEILGLGLKSIVAGTLATCLTAATIGLIV